MSAAAAATKEHETIGIRERLAQELRNFGGSSYSTSNDRQTDAQDDDDDSARANVKCGALDDEPVSNVASMPQEEYDNEDSQQSPPPTAARAPRLAPLRRIPPVRGTRLPGRTSEPLPPTTRVSKGREEAETPSRERPGAYQVAGRAFGAVPFWARMREASRALRSGASRRFISSDDESLSDPERNTASREDAILEMTSTTQRRSSSLEEAEGVVDVNNIESGQFQANLAAEHHPEGSYSRPIDSGHAADASSSSSLNQQPKKQNYHARWIVVTAALVAIGVAVGVGVGVGSTKTASSSTASTDSPCDFAGQEQPNILQQCSCFGTVNSISSSLSASYTTLTTLPFLPLPVDFNEPINSCSPINQALLWLANDTIVNANVSMAAIDEQQHLRLVNRFVLSTLYFSWNGTAWYQKNNWVSSTNECNWYGVGCQQQQHQVITELTLCSNNLSPATANSIPTELFALTGLQSLSLAGNFLVGTFPSSLSKLSKLESLQIGNNNFTGSFPFMEVASLSNLRDVDVSLNNFVGTLPTYIGQLTTLESLRATYNLLSGSLPSELGLAQNLSLIDLTNNLLNGTIPSELTNNMSKLEHLSFSTNLLSGSLPSTIGLLTNLVTLVLSQNAIQNTIPTEIGLIKKLERLDLSSNYITGEIPKELFRSSNLRVLSLVSNILTGSLPSNIGTARLLECLDVTHNQLVGTVPSSICGSGTLPQVAVDCFDFAINSGCSCCTCVSNVCLTSTLRFVNSSQAPSCPINF